MPLCLLRAGESHLTLIYSYSSVIAGVQFKNDVITEIENHQRVAA